MILENLAWFEETGFSLWLRESGPAFFGSLIFHSLAMGLVVGINIAINLRLLGWAKSISLQYLRQFFTVMWAAVIIIIASGVMLLCAYPAKALTNPVFYLKLIGICLALSISRYFQKRILAENIHLLEAQRRIKVLATLSLVLWVLSITAGRFLAYTHNILLASRFY